MKPNTSANSLRQRIFRQIVVHAYDKPGLSPFNQLLFWLITFGVFISILDTEPEFRSYWGGHFRNFELFLSFIFALEYSVRLWVISEDARYGGVRGRLKFMLTPMAIFDLVAFLPSLLTLGGSDLLLIRIARIARFARFAALGRYTRALQIIVTAIQRCWRELVVSFFIALSLLVLAATLLFFVEGEVQPEQFGSIPRALWWAVATLTTIGYGDVYPVTALGKTCAGLLALTGIGLVSMPTAILAGAFSDQFKAARESASNPLPASLPSKTES